MNTDIKERWVAALRSGDYRQRQGTLRAGRIEDERYCCLGVLCELAVADGVIPKPRYDFINKVYTYAGNMTILPVEVVQWAELDDSNPKVTIGGQETSLITVNDSRDWDFSQIADLVEEQL